MSTFAGDFVNINRGFFRLFLIGFFAVCIFLVVIFYNVASDEAAAADYERSLIQDYLTEPACQEIIAKRGSIGEIEAAGCLFFPADLWYRALALNDRTGQEINMEMFDNLIDDEFHDWLWTWDIAWIVTTILGLYLLGSLSVYAVYRILHWVIAGFKSD